MSQLSDDLRRAYNNRDDVAFDRALKEVAKLEAENALLRDKLQGVICWLRANADSEQDAGKRAAFVEAHNAAIAIKEEG